jgi:hypothetical protein
VKAKNFGVVAVMLGGPLLRLDSRPACGDATAEARVAAAQGMLILELVSHA